MLHYEDGKKEYRSALGAFLTLSVLILTVIFTTQQIITLYGRKGTIFTQSVIQDYYDDTHNFSFDDGFRFAFAITDSRTADFSDPQGRDFSEFIEITADQYNYQDNEDGVTELSMEPIDIHLCSE